LANDTDPNDNPLTIVSVGRFGENGDAFLREDGIIIFTPYENYNGPASFTYTVSDGRGGEDTATVYLDIRPDNDGPAVVDDFITRYETNERFHIITAAEVFANDYDEDGDVLFFDDFSVVSVDGNVSTDVSLSSFGDNILVSLGREDFFGTITVAYTAEDTKEADSVNSGLITLEILPQREGPEAVIRTFEIDEGSVITLTYAELLGRLYDADGDELDISDFSDSILGDYNLGTINGAVFADDENGLRNLTVFDIEDDFFGRYAEYGHSFDGAVITSIDGSDLPEWVHVNGARIYVDFPVYFTGSLRLLVIDTVNGMQVERVLDLTPSGEIARDLETDPGDPAVFVDPNITIDIDLTGSAFETRLFNTMDALSLGALSGELPANSELQIDWLYNDLIEAYSVIGLRITTTRDVFEGSNSRDIVVDGYIPGRECHRYWRNF